MKHKIGFDHAFAGIKYAFTSQPNFRVHLIFAILAILLANVLSVSQPHWLILIFTICLVFITEMVNTAIESLTDLIEIKQNQYAKIAKDVSAGMVLLTSVAAVFIGLIIFIPYII